MRNICQVLRLFFAANMSIRAIARCIGASPSTVGDYVRRARVAGVGWPLPEGLSERALEARLFPPAKPAHVERPLPQWAVVHRELRRKGVTLALLWQEYKAEHAEGLQYSQFCERYRAWSKRVDAVMRQEHRAGEKMFVDYAGHTAGVVDRATGEVREAQVFVAVLGASSYTFAEATWTQSLPDWTGSHVRALAFFGGAAEILVPDNLRAAVTSPHLYEPELNPTYQDLASHYAMAIVPARVRKPRDKAKAEVGVQLVERWILAVLRNRLFFSLGELNAEIARLLERLNTRPFRKLPGSRREAFESLDRPALQPLPLEPYEFAQWKKVRVHVDYHVELERHYYSVPHVLIGKQLLVRYTARTVECLHHGERVASHARSFIPGRHTTVAEHMPERHRHAERWSPARFRSWALKSGPGTAALIERVLASRRHPEQSYRTCLGILRLGKSYGDARLEAACRYALTLGSHSLRSVESILKHRLDEQPQLIAAQHELALPTEHDNLRGADYFH
ncbi:MAG TPA: IS21 family transposase [Myxococcota bacterium]